MQHTLPISLCMIVKNEEKHLAACLNSVKEWVAEMIVVDTGSSDNTVSIAEKAGAKIFYFEWIDNFAKARNYSLSKATYPWILQLDADEEILPECRSWFFNHYPWAGMNGYACTIKNLSHIDFDDVQLSHLMVRFFRNKSDIKYINRIHEHVDISMGKVAYSDIQILHKGYGDPDSKQTREKRNRQLLEADYEKNPENPDTLGYLAQHYGMTKDYEKAATYGLEALKRNVKKDVIRQVCLRVCFMRAIHTKDRALFNKVATYTDENYFPEIHFYEAHLLTALDKKEEAQKKYVEFLNVGYSLSEKQKEVKIIRSIFSIAHLQLGLYYMKQDNIDKAITELEKGTRHSNTFFQGNAILGKLYYEKNRLDEAYNTFILLAEQIEKLGAPDFAQKAVPKYLDIARRIKKQAVS